MAMSSTWGPDEESTPMWGGGAGFRRFKPQQLTEDMWTDLTPLPSRTGQQSQPRSALGAVGIAAENCSLQMKWAPTPARNAWDEANDGKSRCKISKNYSGSGITPVGDWQMIGTRRSPNFSRNVEITPLPCKENRAPILSVSIADWPKLHDPKVARKAQQIIVSSGDLVRCKGDLVALKSCQIPDAPKGDTFKSTFDKRCRAQQKHRDPWKGVPNPERTRKPTDGDLILNQIWPESPKAKIRFDHLDLVAAAAELEKTAHLRPRSSAGRRHSWGGDSSTRPSSSAGSTRPGSYASSSANSTRPSSAAASNANSPRGETSAASRQSSSTRRPVTANRRHSFGPGCMDIASVNSPRGETNECPDLKQMQEYIKALPRSSSSGGLSSKRPGTGNRRHSFGPDSVESSKAKSPRSASLARIQAAHTSTSSSRRPLAGVTNRRHTMGPADRPPPDSSEASSPRAESLAQSSTSSSRRPLTAVTNRRHSFGPGDQKPPPVMSHSATLADAMIHVSAEAPERERRARRRSM